MSMKVRSLKPSRRLVAATAALVLITALVPGEARATHEPADKIGVSASVQEVMQATAVLPGTVESPTVTLLSATLRNSTPTDLIIELTTETALWTNISSPASEAGAKITAWVEIDGTPVPVTSDSTGDGVFDDPDDGKVVADNRTFRIDSLLSPGDVIRLFEDTRAAHAFTWVGLNVGNGIHTIEVKAKLKVQATGFGSFAQAAVGKRTLVVQPAKLANDVSI